MSHSAQFPALLMLPLDTHRKSIPSNTAINKSGEIPSHKPRTTTLHWDNDSPSINDQLEVSNTSSGASSVQSTSQFEFDTSPTWTPLPDEGSITSPTSDSDNEGDELQVNDDSDIDGGPCKRQRTETGPTMGDGRIKISNILLLKSPAKRSTPVDGRLRKHRLPRLQNFDIPTGLAAASANAHVTHLAISNKTSLLAIENTKKAEPSSTKSISSCILIEQSSPSPTITSPTTVIGAKSTLSQDPSVKEEKESSFSTHSRKRTNGLSGLLVPRPLAMPESTSTSDSLYPEALNDREEPPRKTRGLALRPSNSSYGAKSKKSQGHKIDQDELELWTNADVAHVTFRKSDDLRLPDEAEEENAKRGANHILTYLMETESSNEDVARNEGTMTNSIQNQVAMPDTSIYTRCDDLVEEIFGPDSRNRRITLLKPKTSLIKQPLEKSRASSTNTDIPIISKDAEEGMVTNPSPSANHSLVSEVLTMRVDQTVSSLMSDVMETEECQVSPSCTSVYEDGHQSDFSDILTEVTSHPGEHQLLRKMQNLYSEDVTVLGKRTREGIMVGEKTDTIIWYDLAAKEEEEEAFEEEGSELDELEMDEDGHDRTLTADELRLLETPSKVPEWMEMVKSNQPVDELGMAVTSDIERRQVENALKRHCSSIDNSEEQEDEETRHANSLQVPLLQLEDWSTTLLSLIKGKKKFQLQDLINLKNILEAIYNNRANISATSSLAQKVYEVSQLGIHDVPNQDELGLRALAMRSIRFWGIRKQKDA